jgi:hypothetical protein
MPRSKLEIKAAARLQKEAFELEQAIFLQIGTLLCNPQTPKLIKEKWHLALRLVGRLTPEPDEIEPCPYVGTKSTSISDKVLKFPDVKGGAL